MRKETRRRPNFLGSKQMLGVRQSFESGMDQFAYINLFIVGIYILQSKQTIIANLITGDR